jgi:hypothetical protein
MDWCASGRGLEHDTLDVVRSAKAVRSAMRDTICLVQEQVDPLRSKAAPIGDGVRALPPAKQRERAVNWGFAGTSRSAVPHQPDFNFSDSEVCRSLSATPRPLLPDLSSSS